MNFSKQDDSLEKVVMVDHNNLPIGVMDKLLAHKQGILHRAFSVFIFNSQGKLLLQKRAREKYHSPEEWANTCCGHPREGESNLAAAERRLFEEMGLTTQLTGDIEFIYQASLANNLIEHEFVQFFKGLIDYEPKANPFEVADYLWVSKEELLGNSYNLAFAPWFKVYLKDHQSTINDMFTAAVQTL